MVQCAEHRFGVRQVVYSMHARRKILEPETKPSATMFSYKCCKHAELLFITFG